MTIAIFATVIFFIWKKQPVGNPDRFIQLFPDFDNFRKLEI